MQGGLQDALLQIVARVIDHPGVENLYFRLDPGLLHGQAHLLQEGRVVVEDAHVHPVHGAAVEAGHLGLEGLKGGHPGLLRVGNTAGGSQVEDDVAVGVAAVEGVNDLLEGLHLHGVIALLVPDMDVGHGGSDLPALIDLLGDLVGLEGHVGVVLLLGPGAGGGYGDDALVLQIRHGKRLPSLSSQVWLEWVKVFRLRI